MVVKEHVLESVVREWAKPGGGETDWYTVMEEPPTYEENQKYLKYLERQGNDKAGKGG